MSLFDGRRAGLVGPLLLLVAVGCGQKEPPGPAALTPQQATDEYRSEAATLALAPKWSWPEQPIEAVAPDGSGMVYQPGFGKQAADNYWYCSWASHALAARPDSKQRTAAITELGRMRSMYYYTTALDPESRPALDQVLKTAALGDMSALRRDVKLNCPAAPKQQ